MNNNFNFKTANLIVDYITFKFKELKPEVKRKLVHFFFTIGFNSYQEFGKLAKPEKEAIKVKKENQFEILFVEEAPYWTGTLLHLSGKSASKFYQHVKEISIDWSIFSDAILSRFDLQYDFVNSLPEENISLFFQDCYQKLQPKFNVSYEKNIKGKILKIGNRRSDRYSRIYNKGNTLRFEHEMKGKFIQQYQSFLIENQFEEFERILTQEFLTYLVKTIPLDSKYSTWLAIKLRPSRKTKFSQSDMSTDYIRSEIKSDPHKFILLLQFLNYAQDLDFEIAYVENISYRIVKFKLKDFLLNQNQSTAYYNIKKSKQFFENLQSGIHITSFTDTSFQSLAAVPIVKFQKVGVSWNARVWIVEDLFSYQYPFSFPDFFKQKLTKPQFLVRFEILKRFSSYDIQKVYSIKDFIESYPSVLSNQQITQIKEFFIQSVSILEQNSLIQSKFQVFENGKLQSVKQLTLKNISEGFVIYEQLDI